MSVINDVWAFLGDLGTKPTAEKIAEGFVRGDKATFQLFNWLFNRHETKINLIGNSGFANLAVSSDLAVTKEPLGVMYDPVGNAWWVYDETNVTPLTYGLTPSFGIAHTGDSGSPTGVWAITPTRVLISLRSSTTAFLQVGVSSQISSMSMTLISSMCSKYTEGGTDEAVMIGGIAGATKYSVDGATSWTSPSVAISSAYNVDSLIWTGGETFKALAGVEIFTSTDNGDNWNAGTTVTGLDYCNKMCYDTELERLIVGGIETTTLLSVFKYSEDGGYTWHDSEMEAPLVAESVNQTTYDIKYCGQGRIVASGVYSMTGGDSVVLVSIDSGESWNSPFLHEAPNGKKGISIATDGKRFIVNIPNDTGGSGTIRSSLSTI